MQANTDLPAWVVQTIGKRECEHALEVQRLQAQINELTAIIAQHASPPPAGLPAVNPAPVTADASAD